MVDYLLTEIKSADSVTSTRLDKGYVSIADFDIYREQKKTNGEFETELSLLIKEMKRVNTNKSNAKNKKRYFETKENDWSMIRKAFGVNSISLKYLIYLKAADLNKTIRLICETSIENLKHMTRFLVDVFALPFEVFNSTLKRLHPMFGHGSFFFLIIGLYSSFKVGSKNNCIFVDSELAKGKSFKIENGYWRYHSGPVSFNVHRIFGIMNYVIALQDFGFSAKDTCILTELTNDVYNIGNCYTGSHLCHEKSCVNRYCIWFEKQSINNARNTECMSKDKVAERMKSVNTIDDDCTLSPPCHVHFSEDFNATTANQAAMGTYNLNAKLRIGTRLISEQIKHEAKMKKLQDKHKRKVDELLEQLNDVTIQENGA